MAGQGQRRLIVGTIEDIADKAKSEKVESPAILVVGEVVGLAEILAQEKIAILRPAAQQEESVALAERYGFKAISAPSIALEKMDCQKICWRGLLQRSAWPLPVSTECISLLE